MEPARRERDDGSRNSGRLTCEDTGLCEHLSPTACKISTYGLFKERKQHLTCMRASPGDGLTTSMLARIRLSTRSSRLRRLHNHRLRRRQFLMASQEKEAGRVAGRAEVDDHDAVL